MVKFKSSVNVSYIIVFVLVLRLGLLSLDKNVHLRLNMFHSPFFDVFFKYVTYLGDGLLFLVFTLLFLLVKKRHALRFLNAGVFCLLITTLMKKVIFKGVPRPIEYFGADALYLIDGVKMCHWNSFPSGHSMTAFAIFGLLYFYFKKKPIKYVMLCISALAAFSRVYLSQHFLLDVLVGSLIGFGIAKLSVYMVSKLFPKKKKKKKVKMSVLHS